MAKDILLHDVGQGTDDWHGLRCGKLTASTMKSILTPTLKVARNEKTRAFAYELAAQRISGEIEETPTTHAMLRGHIDEQFARAAYEEKYAPVREVGFITNPEFPHIGYSPDGLVGDDGLIEIKSRAPKFQIQTVIANAESGAIPSEYMLQIQTGLMVTGREWLDFISFSHGLPMLVQRVLPDADMIAAIQEAAAAFEADVCRIVDDCKSAFTITEKFTPTERIDYEGMIL